MADVNPISHRYYLAEVERLARRRGRLAPRTRFRVALPRLFLRVRRVLA
jgi:hypothetical protein